METTLQWKLWETTRRLRERLPEDYLQTVGRLPEAYPISDGRPPDGKEASYSTNSHGTPKRDSQKENLGG